MEAETWHNCLTCGVRFSIPIDLDKQFRKCHNSFFCPNGHRQFYSGKTEEEKLREERDMYKCWYKDERNRNGELRRSNSALRGVITRMKKE